MIDNPYAQWTLNFNAFWQDCKAHQITSDSRANQNDMYITLGSGERTCAEQAALYAKGRTAPGRIVTRARPGQSAHNYGLARDLILHNQAHHTDDMVVELYGMIYYLARDNYLESGANWKGLADPLHIQLPGYAKRAQKWNNTQRLVSG